jgi:hypothetical protein
MLQTDYLMLFSIYFLWQECQENLINTLKSVKRLEERNPKMGFDIL